ncbi:MAG TPA: serine/threonine-protein kinase [Gemmatimonadaceae bacterium]|nr:serine/threonine-protein kinase [Gemmatimonadaceae bacterium]
MTPRDALVGTVIAEYAVQDMVGEGGTAMVYRASHPTHGTVALKILRTKLRNDPTAVTRFEREAEFGLRVVHPNVVRTIELGSADGVKYLAIEWAPGELLEKIAKRTGAFPRPQVASIVRQIAAAVDASHRQGIVHRDLKPENLMYDMANDKVRLLDFGIAAEPEQGNDQRLTRDGFFVGTLLYVAPEALSGVLVGPAADQYSLATIAYFLLTGVHPYTARSTRDMLSQLLTQPPTPLGKAVPGLSFNEDVERVVMKGLARQPADRYPSIVDFASALENALTAMPVAAAKSGGLFGRVKGLFGAKDS